MKKGHPGIWLSLAMLLLAAAYSAVLFLLKPSLDLTAKVLYGSTMLSFLLVMVQLLSSAKSGSGVVTDMVLASATAIYFGLQLIVGGIVCMFFLDIPQTPVIIGEAALLAAYLLFAYKVFAAQSHMEAQERNDQSAVRRMRLLQSDIQGLAEEQADPAVKRALMSLAEDVHFSEVTSRPATAEVESSIAQNVAALRRELNDEGADPLARIESIRRLLKERDRIAAISKQ